MTLTHDERVEILNKTRPLAGALVSSCADFFDLVGLDTWSDSHGISKSDRDGRVAMRYDNGNWIFRIARVDKNPPVEVIVDWLLEQPGVATVKHIESFADPGSAWLIYFRLDGEPSQW